LQRFTGAPKPEADNPLTSLWATPGNASLTILGANVGLGFGRKAFTAQIVIKKDGAIVVPLA